MMRAMKALTSPVWERVPGGILGATSRSPSRNVVRCGPADPADHADDQRKHTKDDQREELGELADHDCEDGDDRQGGDAVEHGLPPFGWSNDRAKVNRGKPANLPLESERLSPWRRKLCGVAATSFSAMSEALRRRTLLLAPTVFLLIVGGLQLALDYDGAGFHGSHAANAAFLVAVSLPLLARRRWPVGTLVFVMLAITAWLAACYRGSEQPPFEPFAAGIVAAYALGYHAD